MPHNKRFIVKVQISITSSEPVRQALIYNEDHTVWAEYDAPKDLIRRVGPCGGAWKRYFWAYIDKDKILHLDDYAPDQSW